MSEDQPYFRFHPNAYAIKGVFEASDALCDVCGRPCIWAYAGGIYTAGEKPRSCARCIADGRLGDFLGGHFSLHDIELDDADPALADELLCQTPGVACFNPFPWPVLDSRPLAFLGYGEERALLAEPAVVAAIEDAFRELGWDYDGPSPYALIFREVDGSRYQAVIDLD